MYWLMLAAAAAIGCIVARRASSVGAGIATGIAAYVAMFAAAEVAYFGFGIDVWSEEERVGSAYQWFDVYLDAGGKSGGQADLTDGYFPGGKWWGVSTADAIRHKFDALFDALALKPGMRVLDVGCGYGAWMEYLRERGVDGVGLTLSIEQMRGDVAERRLDVRLQDIVTLPASEYAGRFDAVSMIGSLEHFCKSHWSRGRRRSTYRKVLENARMALRPDSGSRRIAITALVIPAVSDVRFDDARAYFLERHYSGRYPPEGEVDGVASDDSLRLARVVNEDHPEDYRWTSIVNPDHFGNFRVNWDLRRALYAPFMFLTDPFAAHKWVYHAWGVWMWSLGGTSRSPDRGRQTACRLKWEVWEAARP